MQLDCGAVNTNTCPKPVPAEIAVSRTCRARSATEGLLSRFRFGSMTVFNASVSSCGPVAGRVPLSAASYPFIRAVFSAACFHSVRRRAGRLCSGILLQTRQFSTGCGKRCGTTQSRAIPQNLYNIPETLRRGKTRREKARSVARHFPAGWSSCRVVGFRRLAYGACDARDKGTAKRIPASPGASRIVTVRSAGAEPAAVP